MSAWFYLSPSSDTVPPPSPTSRFGEHLTTSTSDGGNAPNTAAGRELVPGLDADRRRGHRSSSRSRSQGFFDTDGTPAIDWSGIVYVDDIAIQ